VSDWPDAAARLAQLAEELRSLSNNGLQFTDDPYQIERFHKMLRIAAELLSLAAIQPAPAIERAFFADIDLRTPLAVVDTAVFDAAERLLLIRRADNGLWALPGGACDVGESPAAAGAREVWEETGYTVAVTHLLGIYDGNRLPQRTSRHLYHLLFAGTVTGGAATPSHETPEVAWLAKDDLPWDRLSPGHAPRIRHALTWRADPQTHPYFD
jgi:ADP-ribose pyrophosphatase YjhB (NUDIX family)